MSLRIAPLQIVWDWAASGHFRSQSNGLRLSALMATFHPCRAIDTNDGFTVLTFTVTTEFSSRPTEIYSHIHPSIRSSVRRSVPVHPSIHSSVSIQLPFIHQLLDSQPTLCTKSIDPAKIQSHISIYASMHISIHVCISPSIHPSNQPSIYQCIYYSIN